MAILKGQPPRVAGEPPVTRRRVLTSVGGAALLAMATACGLIEVSDEVQPSDVIGKWTSKPKKGHLTLLTLSADGTFEWSEVPQGTFYDLDSSGPHGFPSSENLDWERVTTYSGTWSVEKGIENHKASEIRLRPEKSQDMPSVPLFVKKQGSDRSLTYWLGDPDTADRFEFHLSSGRSPSSLAPTNASTPAG